MVRERRKSSRVKCRLHCFLAMSRKQIRARVLDVSEGGLCLLSPVPLERGDEVALQIDVPRSGAVDVEATAWHVRAVKSRATNRKFWCVGMMLSKAGDDFQKLLPESEHAADTFTEEGEVDHDDVAEGELETFHVRVRAVNGPRTRLLTLSAATEDEARALAVADLEGSWIVLEVQAK